MASNEETMRLNAELSLAKFSPQAKQMVKDLAEISKANEEAHSPATKVAKLHAKAYQELREKISGTAETIRGVLSPSMAALGLSGFAAGEALGKVVDGLKEAAKNYHILNDASRRSGMSVDNISAVSIAFKRLGQDGPQAIQSMADFGEAMAKFDRNSPKERMKWAGAYADVIDQLGNKMKGKSRLAQLEEAFKFNQRTDVPLDIKRDIDQNLLHLDPSIASKKGEELRDALEKGFAYQKEHPDNPILNGALHEAFDDLDESMEGFRWQINETFGAKTIATIEFFSGAITKLAKDIRDSFPGGQFHIGIDPGSPADKFFHLFKNGPLDPNKDAAKPDEPPASKPGTLQFLPPKDPFKGGPLDGLFHPSAPDEHANKPAPAHKSDKETQQFHDALKDASGSFTPIAFREGGSGGSDALSTSVKTGMLAAFREWFASTSSKDGGGVGGMQNANYSPGVPASTRSAAAIAASFGNKDYPNSDGGGRALDVGNARGDGSKAPGDAGPTSVAPSENSDASLTPSGGGIDRDKWLAQLNANPALKDSLYRHSLGENDNPMANQAVMEEAANRADIRGAKGFGDKGNLSYFQGYHRGPISAKQRAMLDANFDKVFRQGSDVSNGAIDNSSQGLAYTNQHGGAMGGYGWAGKKPGRFKTTANFGGDGITGHRGVESFEVPGWGESGKGEAARYPEFRKHQLEVAAQRRDLLANSKAGMGGGNQKIEGDAHLAVTMGNMPKGTTADLSYGGLFKSHTLTKGFQMQPATRE
jgi:hypothetical protein